jgi:hypothetical protein
MKCQFTFIHGSYWKRGAFGQWKKIKDNEVCRAVLDDLHAIVYVLIE